VKAVVVGKIRRVLKTPLGVQVPLPPPNLENYMEDENNNTTDKTSFYEGCGCALIILAIGLSIAAVVLALSWAAIHAPT
jgi:hypothetical protein